MKIVSILAIVELTESLDLNLLLEKLEDAKTYENLKIVYIRTYPENYYVSFFGTGKILIYGLKSFDDIDSVAKRILKMMNASGIFNSIKDIKIGNIVLQGYIELNKPLESLIISLDPSKATYEPEVFPALRYKDDINYNLFSNGKVTIVGAKDLEIAKKNFNKFVELINSI